MTTINILIGAGFSINAGLPDGRTLSNILKRHYEREFVREFSSRDYSEKTYTSWWLFPLWKISNAKNVMKTANSCYYEDFYEKLEGVQKLDKNLLEEFVCYSYLKYYPNLNLEPVLRCWNEALTDYATIVNDAKVNFQMVIKDLLSPPYKTEKYENFMQAIVSLLQWDDVQINIFSLNHDLLFEELFSSKSLQYCSGFSPGEKKIGKVTYYDADLNLFKKSRLNLFKLHGSIDLWKYASKQGGNYAKVIDGDPFMMNSEQAFDMLPYFLTGNIEKQHAYDKDHLIKQLFKYFKSSLDSSDTLFVIGYGGHDYEINKFVGDWFKSNNKIFIIDPSEHKFEEEYNAVHVANYVTDISSDFFLKLI